MRIWGPLACLAGCVLFSAPAGAGAALAAVASPGISGSCLFPSGDVRVTGANFFNQSATMLRISISSTNGDQQFPNATDFYKFQPSTFTQDVTPSQRPAGTYVVVARTYRVDARTGQQAEVEVARTTMTLPCPTGATPTPSPTPASFNPKLACDPPAAVVGSTLTAKGTGFPPGVRVNLTWQGRINAVPQAFTVTDPTGGFQASLLIFPHDQTGPRQLVASADPQVKPLPFADTNIICLVTPGSVQPADFAWRR
jgi:hypothetical protein